MTTETWNCPVCGNQLNVISGSGVCTPCENNGWWVDPVGGLHNDGEDEDYDPAAMYK